MRQHMTNETSGERRSRRLHPAWLILIACCFLQAGGMGTINNAAGIMVPAVLGDLQFSQGSFMLYFTIQGLCMTAALPVAGKLLSKVSMRVLVSVGMVVAALAFAAMGQFHAEWQWYVAGAVLGTASAFAFLLPAPIMIGNWFKKKAGLAMGIAMACSGIGGAVMNPLGGALIQSLGWRPTYAVLAVIAAALVLPFSLLVMKYKPADPRDAYGVGDEETATADANDGESEAAAGVSAKRAVRSLAFVCVFLVAGFVALESAFLQLMPTYAGTVGLAAVAAFLPSIAMISNIVGKLVLGWLTDAVGPRNATLCGFGVGAAAFALFLVSNGNVALVMAGAALFGVLTSMVTVTVPLLVRSAFGSKDYGALFSYVSIGTSLVGSLGISVYGFLFDRFGSYDPGLLLGIGASVAGAALLVVGMAAAKRLWAPVSGRGGSSLVDEVPAA
ncbi:MFS transporter [Eggerthella timonensis]|uniref:MFS transporter n=1 Tax=Eggerthella timonensis TaxID=1871008 RepID=UPI001FE7A70F|nr:MFS transporter [Eggerthella timonensis]